MRLSVLIASHNGAGTLPDVLDSLCQADKPADGFDVVIVDNASADDTEAVALSYSNLMSVRVVREKRAGKNIALNTGLASLSSDLVVFTDDDVILPQNFLTKYKLIAENEPSHSLFGGHIAALWPLNPDPRILKEVPQGSAYSITEQSRKRGSIEAGRLYGPNMAVRQRVFDTGLRFDESIGPNGDNYVMGDETDFMIRAENSGFTAWFEPDIVVQHKVNEVQLTPQWIGRRAFIAGRTMVYLQLRENGKLADTKEIFGFPRWAILKLFKEELIALQARIQPSKPGLYYSTWKSAFMRGYLFESRKQRLAENNIRKVSARSS